METVREAYVCLHGHHIYLVANTRFPKCVMIGELVGGAGCVGGAGKRVDEVFPGRPQSFRHQRRPVDDCSPGRGGMAQNGGTFHGEMDRCRGSQGWTMACSRMPERDGKDRGEDSPKQAGSCWFARPCILRAFGLLQIRCHAVFISCHSCFVLLRFRLYAFVEAAALRSIAHQYAGALIATRFPPPFVYLEMSLFPSIFVPLTFSLCMESTSYVLSFRMVFFPFEWCFSTFVTTGWIFDISLCEKSIQFKFKSSRVWINRVRLLILLVVT